MAGAVDDVLNVTGEGVIESVATAEDCALIGGESAGIGEEHQQVIGIQIGIKVLA